ncbi:MAG: 23S rRNA pseudouridine(1911/1915/1917) synthase RluD [Rhodocyclaceae bacterium]|nr:MAG: 23S rRNA pseudouridine(1911/1915/1917) synthase RluD [Rhodocyclaceae bacterium]
MKNPDKKSKNPPAPTPAKASETAEGRGDDSTPLALTAPADCGGARLDHVLAGLLPQHSRNRLQGWIRDGRVQVGGLPVSEPKHKLWGGEAILVAEVPDETLAAAVAEDIPLDIVYEDEALIVIDKPAGLVVHPAAGNWSGTLMNALLHHAPQLASVPRAGIVHRLDKDTSGLLVVAKTLAAQTDLVRQLQARTVKREYQALARGVVERNNGSVDAPIGRHPTQRTKMAVVMGGKPARTRYRVVERFGNCTLIECSLETGRTHQIRVHLEYIDHPLVGDPVYGRRLNRVPRGPAFDRQFLHARKLGLVHPLTGKSMLWKSPLPDDMEELLEQLRLDAAMEADARLDDDFDDDDHEVELIYAYGDGDDD